MFNQRYISSILTIATAVVTFCVSACLVRTTTSSGHVITLPPHIMQTDGLHNLIQVSSTIYSGGEPQGKVGFDSLQALGIKTIVSVDGARPDLVAAKSRGMRYVHIPVGYDSIPRQAALALTRVLRDEKGPVYFHCHHGKHRGPAAAAIACIGAGILTNDSGHTLLKMAGTGSAYTGLWQDVADFAMPAGDTVFPELVEVAEVPDFAAAMAGMSRVFDNLKLCEKSGWTTPEQHPDISPQQETLLLWEAIRESRRKPFEGGKDDFEKWMAESEALALELRNAVGAETPERASKILTDIRHSCKQCHKVYRNSSNK